MTNTYQDHTPYEVTVTLSDPYTSVDFTFEIEFDTNERPYFTDGLEDQTTEITNSTKLWEFWLPNYDD